MNILNNFPLGLTIFSVIVIIGLGIYLYLTYEKPKIKKILILGSKGKIGSFLVKRLTNYEIIEVDIDDNLVEAINQNPDLIIDFSTVSSSIQMFKLAIPLHIPLISGVTGFTDDDLKEIYELAKRYQTSVIIKPNFSEGIKYIIDNIKLTDSSRFTISIDEYHHISKKDSPSGTSKMLSRIYNIPIDHINSYRTEEYLASHEIVIKNDNEEIRITHKVFNKEAYIKEIESMIEKIEKGFVIEINY